MLSKGLALGLLVASLAQGQSLEFVQMSDPQFGMYAENANFAQETANFEFAIATANRWKPAFVVICGDLVNRAGDAAQIAEFHRIAAKLDSSIALHNVPGNHDVGNVPTPRSLADYRNNFGPDYYTFSHGALLGLVLDSSLIQHPEGATEESARQEKWAAAELAKAAEAGVRSIIVFQHIPWFLETADEPDGYFNIPQAIRTRWLELLHRNGVRYTFAGHYHRNAAGEWNGLHVITTGPVGKPLGNGRSGLRIVFVRPDRIDHAYFGLGNLPNLPSAGTGLVSLP